MICPHCLSQVDDDAAFCPHCHSYLEGGKAPARSSFVFCEGCGARLSPHDRTCPKCGRTAPTILSADASADDLAAGKTESFPALTSEQVHARRPPLAPELDPDLTNKLHVDDIAAASQRAGGDDPYHPKRFPWKRVVAALAAVAVAAGLGAFVYFDPFGTVAELGASFVQAASEEFPSSQVPEEGGGDSSAEEADQPLSDADAYARLDAAYQRLVAYHDSFGDVVDDFNGYYAAYDRTLREEASQSAYAMRDGIDSLVEELQALSLEEGSDRAAEVERLVELAGQLRVRADVLCSCWDVSLGYEAGEQPDGEEVLSALRASYNDGTWYSSWSAFEDGVSSAAPAEPSS